MNTESFLSLRTIKKFSVFLSLVKVLFSFSGFCNLFFIVAYFDLQLMALVGFSTSAV